MPNMKNLNTAKGNEFDWWVSDMEVLLKSVSREEGGGSTFYFFSQSKIFKQRSEMIIYSVIGSRNEKEGKFWEIFMN